MPDHVPLQGPSNFRDFGGYTAGSRQVRSGRLYRSDRLSDLSDADRSRLATLNIDLIIDLRRSSEVADHPTDWNNDAAPRRWHCPIFEDGNDLETLQQLVINPNARTDPAVSHQIMVELYRAMINAPIPRRQFRQALEHLAEYSVPVFVVHCSGGKDRTGIFAALLLGLLGVSETDIVADFLLTDRYYDGLENIEQRSGQLFPDQDTPLSLEAMVPIFSAREAYLRAALDEIQREHATIADYVEQGLGVDPAAVAALKQHLLS